MPASRSPVRRRSSRRRKRSVASAPTEVDFTVHSTLERVRRDPDAHRNFARRRFSESTPRQDVDEHEGRETPLLVDEDATSDETRSDTDDEFYVTAVHTTFSNAAGLKKSKSRVTRGSPSCLVCADAGALLKDKLVRLGRFTKGLMAPVVEGVFPSTGKVTDKSEDADDIKNGYLRVVQSVVGLFLSKGKGEPADEILDDPASKHNGDLLPYLTGTCQLPRLSPRRQDNGKTSRTPSEFSCEHYDDVMADCQDDDEALSTGVKHDQRSLRSSVHQWQSPLTEATSPLKYIEEERYFEIADTPRSRNRKPKTPEYTSLLGSAENVTWMFAVATVLLLAAVAYNFQLVSLVIFLAEMFAGDSALAVMGGITACSTLLTGYLIVDSWRRR